MGAYWMRVLVPFGDNGPAAIAYDEDFCIRRFTDGTEILVLKDHERIDAEVHIPFPDITVKETTIGVLVREQTGKLVPGLEHLMGDFMLRAGLKEMHVHPVEGTAIELVLDQTGRSLQDKGYRLDTKLTGKYWTDCMRSNHCLVGVFEANTRPKDCPLDQVLPA